MGHKTGSYRSVAKNKPIKTGVAIIAVCEAKVGYLRTFMVDIGVIDKHEGKKWPYIRQLALIAQESFTSLYLRSREPVPFCQVSKMGA